MKETEHMLEGKRKKRLKSGWTAGAVKAFFFFFFFLPWVHSGSCLTAVYVCVLHKQGSQVSHKTLNKFTS